MPNPFVIHVEFAGRQFDFEVHERELEFGQAGLGKYDWMDIRQMRQSSGGPNFRPCVDLWWRAVEQAGYAGLVENEMSLVLAECYPLVNAVKAVQEVFVDAHLHPRAAREQSFVDEEGIRRCRSVRTYSLPDAECERLRIIAHTRDTALVRNEFEALFLGELPAKEELPAYQEAARAWIGNGIRALKTEGHEGLRRYTSSVDKWMRRLRRRGDLGRARLFLNLFAYECKVAFYRCYANAWIGILQQLSQIDAANIVGQRFMRMWHHQNQVPEDDEIHRDVFFGQVLALHPLSAFVMTSPEHLQVIGQWFGRPDYDLIVRRGRMGSYREYWDLVAILLIAAHEYNHVRQQWEDARGVPVQASPASIAKLVRDDADAPVGVIFEEFAAVQGLVCPACSKALSYVAYVPPVSAGEPVAVQFRCKACLQETSHSVSQEDLAAHLGRDDDGALDDTA